MIRSINYLLVEVVLVATSPLTMIKTMRAIPVTADREADFRTNLNCLALGQIIQAHPCAGGSVTGALSDSRSLVR